MKRRPILILYGCAMMTAFACSSQPPAKEDAAKSEAPQTVSIGGQPVVTLTRPRGAASNAPQFLEATIIPGKGMNLLSVKAFVPGKGAVDVIASPSLQETKQLLDGDNPFGNKAFTIGGAILVPYANRIRGKLSADGQTIETAIAGKKIQLPANWQGKNPGAEKHSMHGLILSSAFEDVKHHDGPQESTATGTLHAGDFGGHWLSKTDLNVQTTLTDVGLEITVTATNAGDQDLPMGIGWHPYFAFPNGDRKQAHLKLPSQSRASIDNYDNVFPSGKVVSTKGTPYDFSEPNGKVLGDLFLDDCFLNLKREPSGDAVIEITDPAAKYGLRIRALSPEIKATQVYAPVDKNFVAVEPQFNLADPYKKEWGKTDTGMVLLKPGKSVSWRVRLELFTPQAAAQ
jgi:aldose 1-epimerase